MSRGVVVVPALLVALGLLGCGPGVDVHSPRVRLALDPFGANALLELFVLDTSAAACDALLDDSVSPDDDGLTRHAAEARPAQGLNDGGELRFDLDEVPAERPLTFYVRATEGGSVLAHDCEDGVVVPANGHVDVELVVREAGGA
jgi:hypothetical protein